MTAVLVGVFGMFGGLARLGISLLMPPIHGFPIATLLINLMGAFFLPLWTQFLGIKLHLSERWILAGGTGFCGAFTTFSSFTLDALKLIQQHHFGQYYTYLAITILGGLLLSVIAVRLAQSLADRFIQTDEAILITDLKKESGDQK